MIKTIKSENVICVLLDIHLWSGRQALKRDHLIAANPSLSDLPPADLASMGSIRICDPEEVRVFQRLKNEAIRVLSDNGVALLGAIAIPVGLFDEVNKKLQDIGARFSANANSLLVRYDTEAQKWRDKWAKENPLHAHLLRRMPDAQSVVGRLSYGYHSYAVQPPASGETHTANNHFDNQLKGLKGELLNGAAAEANDLLTKYLVRKTDDANQKRDRITQKTLRPFKRVSAKLRSFAFVDPCVGPLADVIDSVLQSLPSDGPVEGVHLLSVWNLATMLSNPIQSARLGEQAFMGGADAALLDNFPVDMETKIVETPRSVEEIERPLAAETSAAEVAPLPKPAGFEMPFHFGL